MREPYAERVAQFAKLLRVTGSDGSSGDDAAADASRRDELPVESLPVSWQRSTHAAAGHNAQLDGRFDPKFIERSIRRLVRAWSAAGRGDVEDLAALAAESVVAQGIAPYAEEHDTRVRLRDVRVRDIAISAISPNAAYPAAEPKLSVFVHAEAPDDRPPPAVSGYVPRPLGFTMFWTLGLDEPDPGGWRLRRAHATTAEGLASTPYVLRRETIEEHAERLGAPGPAPAVPRPRTHPPFRYRLSCDYAEHDLRIGGSAATVTERDTAPTRVEAEQLLIPAVLGDLGRQTGEHGLSPEIRSIETRELMDGG